jgi:2-methylisocitrate lyase-like PEP mutase family enzyme
MGPLQKGFVPMTIAENRKHFRALHASGCFILPNPWDIGSAKRLEAMGFAAIASSSAAAAWALGKQDYALTAEDVIAHLAMLVQATALPVNADFETGFSQDPAAIAENVSRAVAVGVAALSIEDRSGDDLREDNHAVECIRAARDACGDAMLVARTEAYLVGRGDATFAIDRLVKFAEAGADVLFAPGVRDLGVMADMVKAVAPKPLNVLRMGPDMDLKAVAAAGVRRISVGGALAKTAWNAFDAMAGELRTALD